MTPDASDTVAASQAETVATSATADWTSRRVLVTGASSGIGRHVARRLLELGAHVVVTARRADLLRETLAGADGADRAGTGASRGHALPCDLADPAARADLVARAAALAGGLDGLVHSAGVIWYEPLGAIDEAHLRTQLEVNLVASLRLVEQALEHLDDGGSTVLLSSTLAARPISTSAVYSATKAGLEAVLAVAAVTGAARGITVNAVAPGVVDTPMIQPQGRGVADRAAALETLRSLHPLGRVGHPSDVTEAVLFLLRAPWTTGATLAVDGGLLAAP